jgi:TfoX/Sxy family transcriptional regulator of competence genes
MNMMGGWCLMLDEKMCVGIVKEQLMARVGPDNYEVCLAREGCSEMNFTGRAMKGYVFVNEDGIDRDEDLEFYVELSIGFNPLAKTSKKKK